MKILFFSPSVPENIVTLTRSLGVGSSTVKPNQAGTVSTADLTELFRTQKGAVACIDAHFGPSDLQFFRELCSLEEKGVAVIRKKILDDYMSPSNSAAVSVALLHMMRIVAPRNAVVFLTAKKIGPNVKTVLKELGASAVIANDDSLKEKTLAFSDVIENARKFGHTFAEGANSVFQAGKKFVETFRHDAVPGARPEARV